MFESLLEKIETRTIKLGNNW